MKMPSLKAKSKPKRHKGNIHFGKIILALVMVVSMVLGNVEVVQARKVTKKIILTVPCKVDNNQNSIVEIITINNLKTIENVVVGVEKVTIDAKGNTNTETFLKDIESVSSNTAKIDYEIDGCEVKINISDNIAKPHLINKKGYLNEYYQYKITIEYTDNLLEVETLGQNKTRGMLSNNKFNMTQSSGWIDVMSRQIRQYHDDFAAAYPMIKSTLSSEEITAWLGIESEQWPWEDRLTTMSMSEGLISGRQYRVTYSGTVSGSNVNLQTRGETWRPGMKTTTWSSSGRYVEAPYGTLYFSGDLTIQMYIPPNNPPTTPSSITVPSTIQGGESFAVSWGASTDPDGDSITYILERQVNGGSWIQIYSGSSRSKTESPQSSWNTVRYRVRAYDGKAYSDYRTSPTRTVIHNSPPTTPANISVPSYVKENGSYTVTWGTSTDADGDSITYYLERQINGGSWTQVYSGSNRTLSETVQTTWNTVRYRVRAYDGIAYSDYRTSNIVTVDRDNPILHLTHFPTNWTNSNVTITATASDATSGVKSIQRPDGTWVSSSSTTYTVSSNGAYTFTVEDNAGNTTTESIEINNIDKINPTIDITDNDNNWHKSFTVNISHSDNGGSGIKTRRYSITNNTTKPTSGWIDLTSENQDINLLTNGNNYVHVQVIDNANNETYVYKGAYKIDNTAPTIDTPIAEAMSPTEIKVTANANDNLSGLHTTPYMFNRDSKDITDWINSNTLVDNNLIANKQYSYKYKAKDSIGNISNYSSEVKRYTLALDPVRVWFVDSSDTSVTLEIEHNIENANTPEVRIVLKERGTSNIVSTSNWSKETTRVLTGLQAGKEYEVYLTTRNGDNIENPEIKAPLVDTEGNPIDYVVTVVPVSNFRVIESSVNSLTVSWDQVYSQEYQVYLKDELGNEIPNTRSNWIADDTYTFSNLPLPNTKYVPYIITRKVNSTIHLPEKKVLNEERAYTDAENLTYATFEPFKTSIKITLDTTKLKNPADTEYILRNDINGTTKTVVHSNPVWENTNLKEESFYIYSVKVINKNGKPSDYFKLIFRNGEPHTLMPDIEVPNLVDPKDYIDLDRLKTWDYNKPIDYFVPTELNNKYVKHDDIIYYTTSEKSVTIGNDNEVNALYYAVSDDGYGYTRWRELNEGYFNEVVEFNVPGKYKVHFIFKNYNTESETAIVNYFVDWLKPTIKGESAIKGQTAVTDDSFTVNIEIEDNVSPYLFYSIDDGNTWYLLKDDINQITFNNIIKSREGTMNRLTITICDINSNTTSKTFTVWGIEK